MSATLTLSDATGGPKDEREAILDRIRLRIRDLKLNLEGLNVVTEAATGPYATTAVIAAMAGAERVLAVGRDTRRYGSFDDAVAATNRLAAAAGVEDRLKFDRQIDEDALRACDVLTNSGHLRPITRTMIARLPRRSVIALMFEAWEYRAADLDLAACREFGVRVAAVNERHPDVGVFPFLGPLCVRLLQSAAIPLDGSRVALLCDNPFAPYLLQGLNFAKCEAELYRSVGAVPPNEWDVVVVALDPARNDELSEPQFRHLAAVARGARIAQFWGDVDRNAARKAGFADVAPFMAPAKGHMGVLLSEIGPEPIIRLQAGGLKAAEYVLRGGRPGGEAVAELL